MKIVHLIDSAGVYGAEKVLLALCVELRRLGVDASVLSARLPGETARAIDFELRKVGVPVVSWPMGAGLNLRAMRAIHSWAVKERVDVLHSHGYKFNVLLAATAGAAHIRKVTTVHGYTWSGHFDRMTIYNALDRVSHFAFDRVVYVSPTLQRRSFVSTARRSSIPNGIELGALPVSGTLASRTSGKGGARLIAVGRLAPEKDYELLLQAVALLTKRGVNISLDIFGEGPEEARLRRIMADERLDHVNLRGYSDQILAELASHDILVVSSRTEGMPIIIIEAMCLGMGIVATRVGGIPSMLENYPRATLPKGRAASSLADAIQAQVASPRMLDVAEVDHIRAHFSSSMMAHRYMQVYEGISRSSRSGLPAAE